MKIWVSPVLLFVLFATGCGGSSPTAPAPASPLLRIDQKTPLTIVRHGTSQLRALFGVAGAEQDVTSAAVWTSSNPHVVTVQGGVVTSVDIGTASVTAAYQGQQQTLAVTARRRTRLLGVIRVSDASGQRTIQALHSYVDDREAGETNESHAIAPLDVRWGGVWEWLADPIVDPGSHTVSVDVGQLNPPNTYNTDSSSQVIITDADTMQSLEVITLRVQSAALQQRGLITWTVQIGVYSS